MSDSTLQSSVGLRAPIAFAIASLLLFGLGYSAAGTAVGGWLFPAQAQGSLIERGDTIAASALVAQPFVSDRYFQARPSAANYDPMAAAGSNQSRSNPDLRKRIDEARAQVARREGIAADDVPAELITQSGSGLDPHLSPAAARVQVARVARVRGIAPARVIVLVQASTEARQFGVLGEPRVNVLRLNRALDVATSASLR